MSKARSRHFLPWWIRRHLEWKAMRAALRARDGELCWRCHKPMRFEGPPNCGKAATIEHLLAKANGGGNELANLVLCHRGCNHHLGVHSRAQKERMRINRREGCGGV